MKKFLVRILLFVVIFLAIVVPGIVMTFRGDKSKICFVTNSVSYNAKAKFLSENMQKLHHAPIVVLGSSMGLNNLDCRRLEKEFNTKVINLSAWGMKLSDYEHFPIWEKDRVVLMNMYFSDFGPSTIQKYQGYPLGISKLKEFMNVSVHLQTYKTHLEESDLYTSDAGKNDYTNLNYDHTGTVILGGKDFVKDAGRWEKILDAPTQEQIEDFVKIVKDRSEKSKLIIAFSPARRAGYTSLRSQTVETLARLIAKECPRATFLNNYNINFGDSLFVDNCHFNEHGVGYYTDTVLTQLKQLPEIISLHD